MSLEEVKEKVKNVFYLLSEEEVETLYKYASQVPEGGTIVDIGTCRGGSAFILALGSHPSVMVYTIDPVKNESFFDNRKKFGLTKKVVFIHKTSIKAVPKISNCKVNLMFIDGIHSGWGVTEDMDNLGVLVKSSGIIIFHDYYCYDSIKSAVDTMASEGRFTPLEIVDSLYNGDVRTGMYVAQKL